MLYLIRVGSIIYLLLLYLSCVTSQVQKLNPAVYYKNDICVEYDTGKKRVVKQRVGNEEDDSYSFPRPVIEKFCGVGVLPYADKYKLKVKGYDKLNFFSMTTCHEEDTTENPDKGIFKKNGQVKAVYTPTIEKDFACPLHISAYSRKQRHSWGIIAFENPRFTLPAIVRCNGFVEEFAGVSICQSRKGLIQEIEFPEEVFPIRPVAGAAERFKPCPELDSKDNKTFTFQLPPRECVYGFIGEKSQRVHKFFTVGYEEIIIRDK